jgi:trimeric autotransporter adhesin
MKTKNLFLVTIIMIFITSLNSKIYAQQGNIQITTGFNMPAVTTTNFNSSFGYQSMFNATLNTPLITPSWNSAFGAYSLRTITTGQRNNAFGYRALEFANGSENSAYGYDALRNNTTGSYNVAIGNSSLSASLGNYNVAVGFGAGYTTGPYTAGSNNVFIGTGAGSSEAGSNRLYINNSGALYNNPVISQRPLIYGEFDNGNLTFNVSKLSSSRLTIASGVANTYGSGTSGLRFANLLSTSAPVASNGRVLTVNASGDVVLTTDQGSGGSTLIQGGSNVTVTGTGVTGNPYVISSSVSSCNLYSCDGTLNTLPTNTNNPNPGLRTVIMGNNNLFFQTNSAFDGNGRLYIGSSANNFTPITATSRYRLFVEGGILTERVKVATNGTVNWADYVFAEDYKLAPLADVEKFIKENNHLPGIESAETLSKQGLDLGDMQAKQMAKIEELTLYVIQQNKEIEELKKQVKALLERK